MPTTYYTTAEVITIRNRQAERLKKKFESENAVLTRRIEELNNQIQNETLSERTVAKLKKWVDHFPSCKINSDSDKPAKCSCGLDKVLSKL